MMTRRERIAERLCRASRPGQSGDVLRSLHESARELWLRVADEVIRMLDRSEPETPVVDAVSPIGPNGPVIADGRPRITSP